MDGEVSGVDNSPSSQLKTYWDIQAYLEIKYSECDKGHSCHGMTKNLCFRSTESPQKAKLQQINGKQTKITSLQISFRVHQNTRKKMDSNSSLDWPQVLNDNGTYKFLYLEGNVSYVDFYLHQPWVAAVFITSYLLIFLLCMVGNGGVCFIILWSKHMRTVTNLFILNLAVSDLLVGLFCMPTTLLDSITAGWPFGSLVCKMSGMVQGISVSASVFTLVAIAVDSKSDDFAPKAGKQNKIWPGMKSNLFLHQYLLKMVELGYPSLPGIGLFLSHEAG
ncbi:hypothetical protein TURU_022230 [Turdus rufiventris]|nr:hypothetical protein TURU_022230 [Turdus rufiventris]